VKRLRILQIFNRYIHFGGEEASVFRIGDALQASHDVEYFFGSTEEFMGVGLGRRLTAPLRAFHDPGVAAKLRRYQELGKFDLWQIHNVIPGLSPSVYETAFRLKVPVVHFLHNYRFGCVNGLFLNHGQPCQRCIGGNFWPAFQTACWHDSRLISGWQALILLELRRRNLFRKINRWVALSESQKALHLKMGFPETQLSVVPHFYEIREPVPPAPSPQGPVLFLSRLSVEKGGQELLKAWSVLPQTARELWIAGTGPDEASLRAQASSLPNVKFLGFLDKEGQQKAWAECSFAVIPSLVPETFGMIVLEAWARQRPVVAYQIGALAETIEDGVNGLLVEPGSTLGLAKAIEHLGTSPGETQKMGLAGYKKLTGSFTTNLWLDRMENVYRAVLPSNVI
jgi:glycosyltransferase involved in cell wall biosynthesis